MKNQDKKMLLFIIATIVTSFGIGYNLLKNTYAGFANVTGQLTSFYTLNYVSNYPGELDLIEEQRSEKVVDINYVIIDNVFNALGYEFVSWNTSVDGAGKEYNPNDNIILDGNLTLYAQWKLSSADETEDNNTSEKLFDDENFYRCVVKSYNLENYTEYDYTSYSLNEEELAKINNLSCNGYDFLEKDKIVSTKGLEKLVSLKSLDLSYNLLTKIDVSKNVELVSLNLGADLITYGPEVIRNKITELDLSNNVKLTYLNVNGNQLTEIDVSKNTLLTEIEVGGNKLTGLNLNNNLQLNSLIAYSNELNNIDLSNNKLLLQLDLTNNNLEKIDLSKNIDLEYLWIGSNKLKNIDLSQNIAFKHIECKNNMFNNEYYIYVGDKINLLNNFIKFPGNFDLSEFSWTSSDDKIASVDKDGNVLTKNSGSVDIVFGIEQNILVANNINVVNLYSDKYVIMDNKYIYVNEDKGQEIKDNISLSHKEIEIFVNEENTLLQLRYNDEIIKEFKLLYTKLIDNISVGTVISDAMNTIDINGDIEILDKDDNTLDITGKVKTGYRFRVNLPSQTVIYAISVMGDVNGDGNITKEDIELSSKHIIKGNLINGAEYLKAIDIDNNNITNINDIIRMVKQVKGE